MISEFVDNIITLALSATFWLMVAIGILLNLFIVVVNCWRKSQPLQTIDVIITSLALVRIVLLVSVTLLFIYVLLHQLTIKMDNVSKSMNILMFSSEFCNLWWSSILCVFYCVKITTYSNRLFMRLKMNISKLVPWLLLISLVISTLSSLPYNWFMVSIRVTNGTDGQAGIIERKLLNYFVLRFAGSIIPVIIFCISVGLLIVSLLRHTRHMGSRGAGFSDAKRDIHHSVIRNMISFLLCYVLYFLGSNLLNVSLKFNKRILALLFCILMVALPSLHSSSIILSNRQLKNAILALLRCSWIRDKVLSKQVVT